MVRVNRIRSLAVCLSLLMILVASCGDDGNGPVGPGPYNAIKLNIFEPDPLNAGYVYHLWAMTSSGASLSAEAAAWSSVATFLAIPQGAEQTADIQTPGGAQVANNTLVGLAVNWEEVDSIYVTIEPADGSPTSPQGPVYLVAAVPDSLELQTIGGLETQVDVTGIGGSFTLATPTDNNPDNDTSGVWFLRPFDPPTPSLTINDLPSGWQYESWAWHEETWLSMGTFTEAQGQDSGNPYSGQNDAPDFPGEDFLNTPTGEWVFVQGDSVMITLEPIPDTDPDAQFSFRILGVGLSETPLPTPTLTPLQIGDDIQYVPGGNVVFMRSDDL